MIPQFVCVCVCLKMYLNFDLIMFQACEQMCTCTHIYTFRSSCLSFNLLATHCFNRFHRLLPLPSSNWNEAIGDFFCHAHPHHHGDHHNDASNTVFDMTSIIPRNNDMLIGDGWLALMGVGYQTRENVSYTCMLM